jgi:hypothetical protein
MQLSEVGRNEPCVCGSGKKYKKCCLGKTDAVLAGASGELDCAALLDEVVASDDWRQLDDYVDLAIEVFEPGAPLEHVRFNSDLLDLHEPDAASRSRLCTAGWLAGCEAAIAQVLDRIDLDADERDALRMAAQLLRRFGAKSPIVEELIHLQVTETVARHRRLANVLSARGVGMPELAAARADLHVWLVRARPIVLSFADWFALRIASEEVAAERWVSGIAARVVTATIAGLERATTDAASWGNLAIYCTTPSAKHVARRLTFDTPPRIATVDEQRAYDGLTAKTPIDDFYALFHELVQAAEQRNDFAGAALIGEVVRAIQRI